MEIETMHGLILGKLQIIRHGPPEPRFVVDPMVANNGRAASSVKAKPPKAAAGRVTPQ